LPALSFVLPHWLYWSGLLLFPLIAMLMVRRARAAPARPGRTSAALGYLFLVTAGFIGIHRFYLRSRVGLLYLPLFAGILYANAEFRKARDALSEVKREVMSGDFMVERLTRSVERGVDGTAAKLESAKAALAAARQSLVAHTDALGTYDAVAMGLGIAILLFLVADAFLLPGLARRADRTPDDSARLPIPPEPVAAGTEQDPTRGLHSPVTDAIGALSGFTGQFVAYWSVLAVFVYYYEVLARYVFNSPTNWAHESMFLMFGMQYLIAGAYAYREDAHVRVDVIYALLPDRGKALCDLLTSVFFFIFAGTLLWTGWIFAADAVQVWEVSFTEWAIQYWPVKATIALGALLILLQGGAKLAKDAMLLGGRSA